MRLVVIESPYAGDVARNARYLRAAMRDSLARGEAPFASHALYTHPGVLDDTDADARWLGISAGLAWAAKAEADVVVYADLGITRGMKTGLQWHRRRNAPIEYRYLLGEWEQHIIAGKPL